MCCIFAGAEAAKQRLNGQNTPLKTKEKAETQIRADGSHPERKQTKKFAGLMKS